MISHPFYVLCFGHFYDFNLYDDYDFKYEFQSRNDEMNLLYVRNKYKRIFGKETSKSLSLLDEVEVLLLNNWLEIREHPKT